MQRKILHIDMDAFYASIEQLDHPEYRGKPLVVGFSEDRGVIAAASYEARQFGIHSAQPAHIAKERCPHLIFARPRFDRYREISQAIRNIFRQYTPLIEPIALDEAFLDVTKNYLNIEDPVIIAQEIKNKIATTLNLTASAGISYNKFLAKIASDVNKPNGLFTITQEEAMPFLAQLPIEDFFGIGKATAKKMHQLEIHTGADLQNLSEDFLINHFGKAGKSYYHYARGIDHRPVEPNQPQKSVGVEETFFIDLKLKEEVIEELEIIAIELIQRARKRNFVGRNCTLKLRYRNFHQLSRSITTPFPLGDDLATLWKVVLWLLNKIQFDPQQGIRLIGLSIANIDLDKEQLSSGLSQLQFPI